MFNYVVIYETTKLLVEIKMTFHRCVNTLSSIAKGLIPDPDSLAIKIEHSKAKSDNDYMSTKRVLLDSRAAWNESRAVVKELQQILDASMSSVLDRYEKQAKVWDIENNLFDHKTLNEYQLEFRADRWALLCAMFEKTMERTNQSMLDQHSFEVTMRKTRDLMIYDTTRHLSSIFRTIEDVTRNLRAMVMKR